MTKSRISLTFFVLALLAMPSVVSAQQTMKKGDKEWTALENTLREADLEWLCQGKWFKANRQDCVDSRAKFWDDQFFEINPGSEPETKAQMVASQTAGSKMYPDVVRGEGPNPTDFRLMAVYGNFAAAVDHTSFKIRLNAEGKPEEHSAPLYHTNHWFLDESGKLAVVKEVTYSRLFVKVNGRWRPAAGASAPLPPSK